MIMNSIHRRKPIIKMIANKIEEKFHKEKEEEERERDFSAN